MYRNFEQPGAVAAFWQRQGCGPASPIWPLRGQRQQPGPAAADGGPGLRLPRPLLCGRHGAGAPLPAPSSARRRRPCGGYALDTEAALGECRLPAGVSALCTDIGQLIRVLGRRHRLKRPASSPAEGVVPYSAICGLPPLTGEAAHARKQEVLRLLARRQVEEARGALRAWFALFGMVGADDVRWAVDTVNRMVISMEDWYYQFVTPPPTAGSRPSPSPPAAAAAPPCWSRCSGNGVAATPAH